MDRQEVLARLDVAWATLSKWNKYDPFIQEGLEPKPKDTGEHGPGRRWRHDYSEEQIKLHEDKVAEVESGGFVSVKDVEIDGETRTAGTEFISPEKAIEAIRELAPGAKPNAIRTDLRNYRKRRILKAYPFGFEHGPAAYWPVKSDFDLLLGRLKDALAKKKKPGKIHIPRANQIFRGVFPSTNGQPERLKVPAIEEALNKRLEKYRVKRIPRSRIFHWLDLSNPDGLNDPEKLPEYLRAEFPKAEFPNGLPVKKEIVPGSDDDFDLTMTRPDVDQMAKAIILMIQTARKRKLKTADEICKGSDVGRWLAKNFPVRYIYVEKPKVNGQFVRCRGYDEKEVDKKLAGRNIKDVVKDQWFDDLKDKVLAAMGEGWHTLAEITSRLDGVPYASKAYLVLQALCRTGLVERDPPLSGLRPSGAAMQHGVRWRKVSAGTTAAPTESQAEPNSPSSAQSMDTEKAVIPEQSKLPVMLSTADLARYLRQPIYKVKYFLRDYCKDNRDCLQATDSPRRNEPRVLYRTAAVWPALLKYFGIT